MAGGRIRKNEQPWHKVTWGNKEQNLLLVGSGRHSYLWVGPSDESRYEENGTAKRIYIIDGEVALRTLAKAILKEVGTRKSARKGKKR